MRICMASTWLASLHSRVRLLHPLRQEILIMVEMMVRRLDFPVLRHQTTLFRPTGYLMALSQRLSLIG